MVEVGTFEELNNILPWGGMRRCVVNPDHSVAYYLDDNNSNLKEGGGEVDWSEVENLGQNVMVEIPKFYYNKKVDGEYRKFSVTESPEVTEHVSMDEWEVHPAFYRDRAVLCDEQDANPTEVEFRYAGTFKAWVDGEGRLRSLPNKKPTVNKNLGAFRNHAKNMGVGWTQMDYYLHYAIQMLYITEYGHPDSQTMIGRGWTGASASATTGATLEKGNYTFGTTSDTTQISYRGIEDFWGNVGSWVDGIMYSSNREVLIGNKGFNNSGTGYDNFGSSGVTGTIDGNIGDVHESMEAGFNIVRTGANYDTGGLYDRALLASGRFPHSGGLWSYGSPAGAFSFYSASASLSYSYLGAVLSL